MARKYYRRRSYKPRKYKSPRTAVKKAIKQYVDRQIEKKAFAVNWVTPSFGTFRTSPNDAQPVWSLNIVRKGTNNNQRDGDKLKMLSIRLRMNIFRGLGSDTTFNQSVLRIALVYDRLPNGAGQPKYSDIFKDANNATTPEVMSCPNRLNRSRFVILHDKHITTKADAFHSGSTAFFAPWKTTHQFYLKFPSSVQNVQMNADAGTDADMSVGALYLVAFMDNQTIAPVTQWEGESRIVYTDA